MKSRYGYGKGGTTIITKWFTDDIHFWETVYKPGGTNCNSSRFVRSDTGLGYWENIGHVVSYPKNHVLLNHEEVPDRFYVVKSGMVIGYEELANGEELIYYVLEKNAMIMEANMLLSRPAGVNFRTMEPTELVCIQKERLLQAMKEDPYLVTSLFCSVSNKFLEAMEELRGTRSYSAAWRLCHLLLEFADRYGVLYDGKILIQKRISIQILTSMLGVNRATTVRSMRKLRDLGLVENINGFYCIRSVEALKRHQELIEN